MKNSNISERVLAHFDQNNNSPLSYNELVYQLKLTKKEKSLLSETLQAMLSEEVLFKQSRKFRLKQKKQEQPKQGKAEAATSPRLIEGIFDATPLAKNQSYAFVRTEKGDFFISAEDTLNAYHGDVILIEPHYRKGKSDYAYVRRIVRRANETLAGDIRASGNRSYFISSNLKIHNWFEISELGGAQDGQKVVLEVSNWGNPVLGKMPVGKVVEVLGTSGDPQVELMAVIRQYHLPLEFPEDVQAEAQGVSEVISADEIARRTDLRELFTFTIDPASAKDFDDAISLETTSKGWRLHVHIADVAHYVNPGGAIFAEAAKRGNSFYFPKKVIPMLPEILSNKVCSLRPDEDKLTLTVITEIDAQGRTLQQKLVESVIRSDFRLSYEEVDTLFAGQPSDLSVELKDALNESRMLSALLSKKRLAEGYIHFDLPELEYEYDDEGLIHKFNLAEETESHKLIENFMLVANEFVAKKLTQVSPTTIYRIHEDPDQDKIEKLVDLLSHYGISYYERENPNASLQYLLLSLPGAEYHKVFDRIILRSMKKAKYSTEHIRHFGLGMETYTHFTSPIRRLCDLIIHHLCKVHVLRSSKEKFSAQQIHRHAVAASEQELQADQAERDIERNYSMAYMKKQVEGKFSGLVISAKSSGLIVRLNEIPINAILKVDQLPPGKWNYKDREMRFVSASNNNYFQLMDKVLVEIMDVSDDIYLELQQVPDAHQHLAQISYQNDKPKPDNRLRSSKGGRQRNAVDVKQPRKKSGSNRNRRRGKR
ncbi:MAG: VacB/RNase II family 3'-5' exoribonuclease [Candidatus Syntrophosphaera sp.]|nr:VacB/RNase II family 3'-5' exoribonuclease [Candidatus Syntrophosphaera sp.]